MEIINFEDFIKTELKIGKIVSAERVEGSDKLLKMMVDLGEKNPSTELGASAPVAPEADAETTPETPTPKLRQILAGIGKVYEPEALVGREALFVANLAPRMIMGLESQGMILAASDDQGPVILAPDREVAPGSPLK